MKLYEVTRQFWRKGLPVEVGATLRLSDAEAKYIGHIVREVKPKAVEPVAEVVAEVAPEVAAEVERPVEKPHRRRQRAEASDGEDR